VWEPIFLEKRHWSNIHIQSLLDDKKPAIIIKGFVDKESCQSAIKKINLYSFNSFQKGKLQYIGPFLMSYCTKKINIFRKQKIPSKNLMKFFQI
jgi:hypothetical protein